MITAPALALSMALALAAGNPAPAGGGHQLLCGQISGGHVSAQSSGHRLHATVAWQHAHALPRSSGHRLLPGCPGGHFRAELFDALFEDRFGQ